MAIQFTCSCGKLLQAREEHAGRRTRCPTCGQEHCIPDADDTVVVAGDTGATTAPPPSLRDDTEIIVPERPTLPPCPTPAPAGPRPPDPAPVAAPPEPPRTSRKAVASLVLGLVSFCMPLLAGVPAVLLGILGLIEVSNSEGRLRGRGLAIAGIVLGVAGSIIGLPILIFLLNLLPTGAPKRLGAAGRAESPNGLKQMADGWHRCNGEHGHFPQVAGYDYNDRRRFFVEETYLIRQTLAAQAAPARAALASAATSLATSLNRPPSERPPCRSSSTAAAASCSRPATSTPAG